MPGPPSPDDLFIFFDPKRSIDLAGVPQSSFERGRECEVCFSFSVPFAFV